MLTHCLNMQIVNSTKLRTNNTKLCLKIQKEVASSKFRYLTLHLIVLCRLVVDREGNAYTTIAKDQIYLPIFYSLCLSMCQCWKDDSRPEGPHFTWKFSHKRTKWWPFFHTKFKRLSQTWLERATKLPIKSLWMEGKSKQSRKCPMLEKWEKQELKLEWRDSCHLIPRAREPGRRCSWSNCWNTTLE